MGLEGIVSKRRGSRYVSGRSTPGTRPSARTGHFAVIGYDRQGRSLRLARIVEGSLVPCGSAGSGLSDADARQVRAALDARHSVIVTVEYPRLHACRRAASPCGRADGSEADRSIARRLRGSPLAPWCNVSRARGIARPLHERRRARSSQG